MRRDLADVVASDGCLDDVWFDGGRLWVRGWAAAADGAALDGLALHLDGRVRLPAEAEWGQPSPDVAAALPHLPAGARARFQAAFDGVGGGVDDRLWLLVPRFGPDRVGRALLALRTPRLPQPTPQMQAEIGGGFPAVALEFLAYFIQLAGLESGDAVLDVGCGFGRMAYALAYFLTPAGRYDGFDIMRSHVDWAASNLTPMRPNFTFRHVDLYNRHYNRRGRLRADAFAFPHADAAFDLVFLTSVFTHLPGREVRHYLGEIARVLKPGGRCLATLFLLNDTSRGLIKAGRAAEPLRHRWGDGCVSRRLMPEWAVGFDEPAVRAWIADHGLAVRDVRYGGWCGRATPGASYQDIVVLERDV